jgi:N-hydroxyarylamine O-acetyltransferase
MGTVGVILWALDMNVSAYLRRIGYEGPLEPSLETLRGLHRAHLLSIPFENLDIPLHRPIVLFRDRLFQKIVERRRGGFCYELNGMFAELLKSLGFEVTLLSARVTISQTRVPPEFDHLTLLVSFPPPDDNAEAERWIADVGFGDSFIDPLRFGSSAEDTQRGMVYRLQEVSPGYWSAKRRKVDESKWQGMYDFSLISRQLSEFSRMCRYHQTSPESGFTKGRVCSIATANGRKTLTDRKFIETRDGQKRERDVDEREYQALLRTEFGIVLD